MRYIKICDSSGTIVGVEKLDNPSFVKYVKRNDLFIGCVENQAQGIVSSDGKSIYMINNSNLKSIKDDIVLNAFFVDEDEFERISFLLENSKSSSDDNSDINNPDANKEPEDDSTSEVLTLAQVVVQLSKLQKQVEEMNMTSPVNDEATTKFYETLSSSSTNSIAKIRQAAQQYLEDTSTTTESEV